LLKYLCAVRRVDDYRLSEVARASAVSVKGQIVKHRSELAEFRSDPRRLPKRSDFVLSFGICQRVDFCSRVAVGRRTPTLDFSKLVGEEN
jgi:hypothetical protein